MNFKEYYESVVDPVGEWMGSDKAIMDELRFLRGDMEGGKLIYRDSANRWVGWKWKKGPAEYIGMLREGKTVGDMGVEDFGGMIVMDMRAAKPFGYPEADSVWVGERHRRSGLAKTLHSLALKEYGGFVVDDRVSAGLVGVYRGMMEKLPWKLVNARGEELEGRDPFNDPSVRLVFYSR